MKRILLIAVLPLLASCGQSYKDKKAASVIDSSVTTTDTKAETVNKSKALSSAWLIIPGKSIGGTRLNGDLDSVFAKLGKSDYTDAAMGASFNTWFARHDTTGYQTDIYAHHNYDGKHDAISYIKIIRVTSPAFQTAESLHTGLALQDMAKHFSLKHVATYTKGPDSLKIYDDRQSGITFEINNAGKCTGILVHLPGDDEMGYLSMHPHMQRVDIKK